MRTIKTILVEALEAYYAGSFEAADPFEAKMSWIRAAIDAGYLDGSIHPRSYSNGLKALELSEPLAREDGVKTPSHARHIFDEKRGVYKMFPPGRGAFDVSASDIEEMKKSYSNKPWGLGWTINEVCRHFCIARKDFQFIRRELGWTHDQDEFTNEQHERLSVEEMLEDRVERSRWLLEQADRDARIRELEAKAKEWDVWEAHYRAACEAEASRAIVLESNPMAENGQRLAVLMLADLHLGEGGAQAASYILSKTVQAVNRARNEADQLVICFGGDFFHFDTYGGTTTRGTKVAHEGEAESMLALGYSFVNNLLEHAAPGDDTHYRLVAGNHDRMATGHLAHYLAAKGCQLNPAPWELAGIEFGQSSVAFHHGDLRRQKPEALLMELIDTGVWTAGTKFRGVYAGHFHHKKVAQLTTRLADVQGALFIQVPTPNATRSVYERQMGYVGGKGLQLDIWSATKGRMAEFMF